MLSNFIRIAVISSCKTLQCRVKGIDGPNILILEHSKGEGYKLIGSFTNPAVKAIRKRGKVAALTIVKYNVNAVIVSDIGPGAFEVFKARKVKVYVVSEGTKVGEAIQYLASGRISEAIKPTHERGHGRLRNLSNHLR